MSKIYHNGHKEFLLPDRVVEILERANEREKTGEVTEEELDYLEKTMEVDFMHIGEDLDYDKGIYETHYVYNKRKGADTEDDLEVVEIVYLKY